MNVSCHSVPSISTFRTSSLLASLVSLIWIVFALGSFEGVLTDLGMVNKTQTLSIVVLFSCLLFLANTLVWIQIGYYMLPSVRFNETGTNGVARTLLFLALVALKSVILLIILLAFIFLNVGELAALTSCLVIYLLVLCVILCGSIKIKRLSGEVA